MPFRILLPFIALLLLAGCATRGGVYHKVAKGQTLYTISRTYGVDEQYLARINGIADPRRLKIGQELYIPGADRIRRVPATAHVARAAAAPAKSVETRKNSPPAGQTHTDRPPVAPASPPVKSAPKAVEPPPARKDRFIWPVSGKVITRFGKQREGVSKGLEIAVGEGSPVVSSAAGKVIYSGDGITGYGNLIILRHDDSFFTVYGYNRSNLVATGAFVSKGQKIALSGTPPKGGKPRLYFEIRHGKEPVDPIFYLP